MSSRLYQQLNDRGWLVDKYINQKMPTTDIASLVGCASANSVRQALLRLEIPLMDTNSAWLHYHPNDMILDLDVINGSLLGDAMLRKYKRDSVNANAYFAKRNKYLDHIELVARALYNNNYDTYISECINKCNGKLLTYYGFRTTVHTQLTVLHDKWYPACNGYKKIVPSDLCMNPKTMMHWYLDDGSSYYRNRSSEKYAQRTKQIVVTFSCEGFLPCYVELLRDICKRDTGLPFTIRKCNSGYGVRLSVKQRASRDFFSYIGECPVQSFDYKWKY